MEMTKKIAEKPRISTVGVSCCLPAEYRQQRLRLRIPRKTRLLFAGISLLPNIGVTLDLSIPTRIQERSVRPKKPTVPLELGYTEDSQGDVVEDLSRYKELRLFK